MVKHDGNLPAAMNQIYREFDEGGYIRKEPSNSFLTYMRPPGRDPKEIYQLDCDWCADGVYYLTGAVNRAGPAVHHKKQPLAAAESKPIIEEVIHRLAEFNIKVQLSPDA